MMALWSVVTVLYRPAVAPDQPWASRRLVPFVLPGLILGGIWAAAWLKDQAAQLGRTRATAITIASCCAASMLIPTALTTLDLSITKANGVKAHGMAFRKIGPGEITAVSKLCASIPPDVSVVILDSLTADRFAQVLRGMCGLPTAVLTDHKALNSVITGIQSVGRRPVLLAENKAELPGTPKEIVNLLTTQEAHNLTAPPTRTWLDPLHRLDEHHHSAVQGPRPSILAGREHLPAREPRTSTRRTSPSCCPASTRKSTCCSRSSGSAPRWTRAGCPTSCSPSTTARPTRRWPGCAAPNPTSRTSRSSRSAATAAPAPSAASAPSRPAVTSWSGPTPT